MSLEAQLLRQLVEEVHALREQLGHGSESSVRLATSARGTDIEVKVYAGSGVTEVGDAALDEYVRVRQQIEQRLMANFEAEATKRQRA